jgi:hypothetical protein
LPTANRVVSSGPNAHGTAAKSGRRRGSKPNRLRAAVAGSTGEYQPDEYEYDEQHDHEPQRSDAACVRRDLESPVHNESASYCGGDNERQADKPQSGPLSDLAFDGRHGSLTRLRLPIAKGRLRALPEMLRESFAGRFILGNVLKIRDHLLPFRQ